MTTFSTTTPAQRFAERTVWKAAVLRSHCPELSEDRALDLVAGRVRLSHGRRDCPVRLAVTVAVQCGFEGEATEECGC
jgi:hypothetical protein